MAHIPIFTWYSAWVILYAIFGGTVLAEGMLTILSHQHRIIYNSNIGFRIMKFSCIYLERFPNTEVYSSIAGTEYQPGTPGGPWTGEEALVVRQRIIKMIDQRDIKTIRIPEARDYKQYGTGYDKHDHGDGGDVTENSLIRLAFHDCVRYKDGTGGCDGCLNYNKINPNMGMGGTYCHPFRKDKFYCDQINEGNNAMLARTVGFLEVLYTTVDFPSTKTIIAVQLFFPLNVKTLILIHMVNSGNPIGSGKSFLFSTNGL